MALTQSACCGGGFKIVGSADFMGDKKTGKGSTHHHECLICGKPCDIEPADGCKKISKTLMNKPNKWEEDFEKLKDKISSKYIHKAEKNGQVLRFWSDVDPVILMEIEKEYESFIRKTRQNAARDVLRKIIKKRPFVDLTRDLQERKKIERYLEIWEQKIKTLKQ